MCPGRAPAPAGACLRVDYGANDAPDHKLVLHEE